MTLVGSSGRNNQDNAKIKNKKVDQMEQFIFYIPAPVNL